MTERELIRRLESSPVPPPPEDLAARIINDIPSEIELHPSIEHEQQPRRFRRRPLWLAAAAAVTVALTGAVTWELRREQPAIEMVGLHDVRQQSPRAGATTNEVPSPVLGDQGEPSERRQETDDLDRLALTEQISEDEGAAGERSGPTMKKGRQESKTDLVQRVTIADHNPIGEPLPGLLGQLQEPASPGLELKSAPPAPPQRGRILTAPESAVVESPKKARMDNEIAVVDKRETDQPSDGIKAKERWVGGKASGNVAATRGFTDVVDVEAAAPIEEVLQNGVAIGGDLAQPSTGGTSEPNSQPFGDVFFEHTGVNPFIDTEDDRLSTFGLDVDTGSFTIARQYLNQGHLPPRAAIRVEEFVNAFDYGDAPPRKGDFRLIVEGAPSVFASSERSYLLRLAVKAREVDAASRPPAVLVFCIDVSGSMDRQNRLGLVKQALHELLGSLRRDDYVGLVVYGSSGRVVLKPTTDHDDIKRAIDRLQAGGSTNAEEGLLLAYDLLNDGDDDGRIRRVILCSDGVANVGKTGPDAILERIQREAGGGIELTSVGFGMGNYNDVLMERLADAGDGRYAYVDEIGEARRIFVEELTGTLLTIGHDAKAQVEFDPEVVSRYRLLGYENRDIADHLFRDPTIDAGEVGAGHTVTAVYEVKLRPDVGRRGRVATLRLRYRAAGDRAEIELNETLRVSDLAKQWEQASPALKLVSLVAEFAEILKGAYWAKDGDLEIVLRRLQHLQAEAFEGDGQVAELGAMVARAQAMSGN